MKLVPAPPHDASPLRAGLAGSSFHRRLPRGLARWMTAALATILIVSARADDRLFSPVATTVISELEATNSDRFFKVSVVKFAANQVTFEHEAGVTTLPAADFDPKNLERLFPGYIARKTAADEAHRKTQAQRTQRRETDLASAQARATAAIADILRTPVSKSDAEDPCVCIIASGHDTYEVWERPCVVVYIVNRSSKDIYLARAFAGGPELDISKEPDPLDLRKGAKCNFEVADPTGHLCRVEPDGIVCLGVGPGKVHLRIPECTTVAPGRTFVPLGVSEQHRYPFRIPAQQPGTYTVRFHYSTEGLDKFVGDTNEELTRIAKLLQTNDPDDIDPIPNLGELRDALNPQLDAQLKRIPSLNLRSNILKIKFVPKAE